MSHKIHRLSHTFSFFLSVLFLWLDNFKWCLQSEWFFFDCLLFKLSIESFGLIIVFFSSKISFFYYYFLLLYWTYFVLVLFCWYGQIVNLCSLIFYGTYSFVYVSSFEEAVTSRRYGLILVTEVLSMGGGMMECTVIQGLVVQGIKCRNVWWHQEDGVVHWSHWGPQYPQLHGPWQTLWGGGETLKLQGLLG